MSQAVPRRVIVEADGGSRGNPGPAAYGAVVRDADTGSVLVEVADVIGEATNNVAEYRGLLAGLKAAHEIAPEAQVEARLDSQLVVEQMSGTWKIKNPDLQALAHEARRIYRPEQVTYTWVPRERNTAADALVNKALDGTPTWRYPDTDDTPGASTTDSGQAARPRNRLPAWAAGEMEPPTRLYVVRHGQTSATVARRFSGGAIAGPTLTDTGLAEARRAGAFIAAQTQAVADVAGTADIAAVVASPMVRTTQTAEAISEAVGIDSAADDAWREVDFGEWEGLTLAELLEQYPAETAAWHDSVETAPPGGESLHAMTHRVIAARDRVVAGYPGRRVVVVTHSMPIRALVRDALEAGESAIFRIQPAPGSVTIMDVFADGTPVVTSLNIRP